jgi:hypothetical protein
MVTYQLVSPFQSWSYSLQYQGKSAHNHPDPSTTNQHYTGKLQPTKLLTTFFNEDFSIISLIDSGLYPLPFRHSRQPRLFSHASRREQLTHSVSNHPGSTALTLTRGPCVLAKHLIKCNCAAFVTLYGIELPPIVRPAMEEVMMKTPPSELEVKVGKAACMRCVCAFTFTEKQVSQSSTVAADKSLKLEKRV